jgi:hypothetical protein
MTIKALVLTNGVAQMTTILPSVYLQTLTVVSGTPGAGQINAVTAGNPITLPASGSFTGAELMFNLNNVPQTFGIDFSTYGSPAPYTQFSSTQNINVGDVLTLLMLRSA